MGKIANAMRTNGGHRTGVDVAPTGAQGRTMNGGCGPAPATVLRSWGSGCPAGACSADQLAAALGREPRYACKEIPYTLVGMADATGLVVISENSKVTICPTRVIISLDDEVVVPNDAVMTSFEIGNQNQIIGDPIPVLQLSSFAYQAIPFVTDCLRAGLPFSMGLEGFAEDTRVFVTLIGPAIG
jgi:hypothetical protein